MDKKIEIGTFFVGVILTFTLKITLDYFLGQILIGVPLYILFALFHALFINLLMGAGTRQINTLLERWIPWQQATTKRLILQTVFTGMLAFSVISIIATFIVFLILRYPDPYSTLRQGIVMGTLLAMILGILYTAGYFFGQWRISRTEADDLKHENLLSQFNALKQQVNPHFLFNALSTLTSLLAEDQERAAEFIQKLSNVYRYVLEVTDKDIVDLGTEIEAVRAYAFLQQTRFGDNLQVNIKLPDEDKHLYVAPLTLQILLENAIKHNSISKDKPLIIDVFVDASHRLVARNNLQRKSSIESGTHLGLKNIVNRYRFLDNKTVEIMETESEFIVKIPLLEEGIR